MSPLSPTNDTEAYQRYLEELGAGVDAQHGFFGPDSLAWRIAREPVLLLLGMRALLLQVAHPKVAQGVADHSDFERDPLARGIRTFTAVYSIMFGRREEAISTALKIHRIHARVVGRVHDALPPHIDPAYRANDPELLYWVASTLLDSSIVAYELFVEPLSADAKEQYYREAQMFGRLFGVPAERFPPTWQDFVSQTRRAATDGTLLVTSTAKEIRAALFRATWLTRLLAPIDYIIAAMLLPEPLASAFDFRRTWWVRLAFAALVRTVRLIVRLIPRRLRGVPPARRRERQLAQLSIARSSMH